MTPTKYANYRFLSRNKPEGPWIRLFAATGFFLAALVFNGCGADSGYRNLLLISIDTLRADHLGCYGYHRDTSPNLDRLAEQGIVFERAISQAPWTLPSHVTMLTSLYPSTHQVTGEETRLDPAIPTLAAILGRHGFATGGFVDHPFVSSVYGLERGFSRFDDSGGGIARLAPRAAKWLREFDGDRFFLFLHVFDVHCPYTPPGAYADRFRSGASVPMDLRGKCGNPQLNRMAISEGQLTHIVDQYDGGIAYTDARLGVFLQAFRDTGRWSQTLIVVTSDHGEEFREHGQIGHERTVHDEILRVPWILVAPGRPAGRVTETVGLIDLVPTVLELLDVAPQPGLQGRSLVHLLEGEPGGERSAYSELDRHLRMRSIHRGSHHLIRNDPQARFQLFDWKTDPGEGTDLWVEPDGGPLGRRLSEELAEWERQAVEEGRGVRPGTLEHLDPDRRRELEEKLRSLGYLP